MTAYEPKTDGRHRRGWRSFGRLALIALVPLLLRAQPARLPLPDSGGGLVVVHGWEDRLTAELVDVPESVLVQVLEPDAGRVAAARAALRARGIYGRVSVLHWTEPELPYVDGLVNRFVARQSRGVAEAEVLRALAPRGVAVMGQGTEERTVLKPWPEGMDEWTHYLHSANGNPVSSDSHVGPPRHLQWVGSPRWSRHHDRMASMSSLVSSGGRIFYIFDEGETSSVILPSRWKLIARDAFNGIVLWKRDIAKWHTQLYPLKSGPAQLLRRLVALDGRVYTTLGLHAPVSALSPVSGETLWTQPLSAGTEELICGDGVVFALVDPNPPDAPFVPDRSGVWNDTKRMAAAAVWDGRPRRIAALNARDGAPLWQHEAPVVQMTLAADATRVYFFDGDSVRALDRRTGAPIWVSEKLSRHRLLPLRYGPNLIAHDEAVLFTGGDRSMYALRASSGEVLWKEKHPPSGHCSQEDLMVVGGLVWAGEIAGGKHSGQFTGRDPMTGKARIEFTPDVETYWFHHRCYRSKATEQFLLPSRTGIEFVDWRQKSWEIHHWIRGGCIYGIMPANGLVYAPLHDCACYLESKLYGFNAVAPASPSRSVPESVPDAGRLVRGPAYGEAVTSAASDLDWPTYRHDGTRSGMASSGLPDSVRQRWRAELGGRLSSTVCAGGRAYVARIDEHTLYALDAEDGRELWHFTAGGRIDAPPAIESGRVYLGAADGYVYCLRADDGRLIWSFRAAPADRRMMAFEQLESPWPVHGNVLLHEGTVYAVAGRSMFVDGGMRLVLLDAVTGEKKREHRLDETDPGTGESIQKKVQVLNMPVALNDVLSTDGTYLYMRSQRFRLDGSREQATPLPTDPTTLSQNQQGEDRHLFSPAGFLDDTWFHRSYWLFGRRYSSGCNWWSRAGRYTPAGRILSHDGTAVVGFGRKPSYFEWTVPLDYHLFSCPRDPALSAGPSPQGCEVNVAKSESLNPAGKPLSLVLWVKAEEPDGVVLARGGASHGYGLVLAEGRLSFVLRIAGELHQVRADADILNRWVQVAAVLAADGRMRLYMDGDVAATGDVPGLLAADPNEAMQLGNDQGSPLGVYEHSEAPRFTGVLDEVRIYHRELAPKALAAMAAGGKVTAGADALALGYSFDDGTARDLSGNGNHGGVGATPGAGRVGTGLVFRPAAAAPRNPTGSARNAPFAFHWSRDIPVYGRALAVTEDTVLVAGPLDTLDEEEAYRRPHDPDILAACARQDRIVNGEEGAWLLLVSRVTGEETARLKLAAPPVWDSLSVARQQAFLSTEAGEVLCFGE